MKNSEKQVLIVDKRHQDDDMVLCEYQVLLIGY